MNESMRTLLRDLSRNRDLDAAFRRTLESSSDPLTELVQVARDHGYQVTAENWRQLFTACGELDDEDLEAVAGGWSLTGTIREIMQTKDEAIDATLRMLS